MTSELYARLVGTGTTFICIAILLYLPSSKVFRQISVGISVVGYVLLFVGFLGLIWTFPK